MTPPMLRALRHDVWATEHLIAHCRTLTEEQLELTAPGTYGTIRRTLEHIVGADERYLGRFRELPEPLLREDHDVPLDEIAAHLGNVRAAVEALFSGQDFDPDRVIRDERRRSPAGKAYGIDAWVLVAQFVHHGSDHRAHIGTILGAQGLAAPDLDVWTYATKVGGLKELG